MTGTETVIFTVVVGTRLLVPLLIFRYPLPAILACLVIDGVDQTIFQTYTDLPLDNYQSYDKALDIYYQSLAYISTLRNWTNVDAVTIGQFLLFYRLVGVLFFELSDDNRGPCCWCFPTRSSTTSSSTRPCAASGTRPPAPGGSGCGPQA